MKKTLLLLLVWFLQTNPGATQGPGDYQFQFQFDNYLREWVQGPDGAWFGVGWSKGYMGYGRSKPFVIKWDKAVDKILWKTSISIPLAEDMVDVYLLPSTDGGTFIAAAADGCDYSTPEGLARLDAFGNLLWEVSTPDQYVSNQRVWLLPNSAGNLILQTDDNQFIYDPAGTLLNITNSEFIWNGFVKNNAGGYLAYGDNMIGSFDPFIVLPFPDNVLDAVRLPTGGWLMLSTTALYRLKTTVEIQEKKTNPFLKPWSKFFSVDGSYWVTGENSSGESVLQHLDSLTLEVLDTKVYDKQYRVLSILHTPGDSAVWLSGECNFSRNQTMFLKSVSKHDMMIKPEISLSLSGIRLSKIPVYYPPSFCSPFLGYSSKVQFGLIYVTVTNTGTIPVSSFSVNGRFDKCSFICYTELQHTKQFNYPLNPGESVEITYLDNLILDGPSTPSTISLCFWTALPDDRLDAIPEDDRYCETFSVIVSDEEATAPAPGIRVSPNPVGDRATFFLEADDASDARFQLVLVNASGQIVRQAEFTGPTWTLERGNLPAGLYFYQVVNAQNVVGKGKIVLGN